MGRLNTIKEGAKAAVRYLKAGAKAAYSGKTGIKTGLRAAKGATGHGRFNRVAAGAGVLAGGIGRRVKSAAGSNTAKSLGVGVAGGVISNAIGGQYITRPKKSRIKKALRGG